MVWLGPTSSKGVWGSLVTASELCVLEYPLWFLVVNTTEKYCEPLGQSCGSEHLSVLNGNFRSHILQSWPQMEPPPLSNRPPLNSCCIGMV